MLQAELRHGLVYLTVKITFRAKLQFQLPPAAAEEVEAVGGRVRSLERVEDQVVTLLLLNFHLCHLLFGLK